MKLKNKKTGEIVENAYIREAYDSYNKRTIIAVFVRDGNRPPERVSTGYETLAALNAEWEDYEEEPKEYWYIGYKNIVRKANEPFLDYGDNSITEKRKEIGNYFETEEEAEKVVEKLKAWKRLKDKGLEFNGWILPDRKIGLSLPASFFPCKGRIDKETEKDLDICFGGEE